MEGIITSGVFRVRNHLNRLSTLKFGFGLGVLSLAMQIFGHLLFITNAAASGVVINYFGVQLLKIACVILIVQIIWLMKGPLWSHLRNSKNDSAKTV
jgi:hypothetical protein